MDLRELELPFYMFAWNIFMYKALLQVSYFSKSPQICSLWAILEDLG